MPSLRQRGGSTVPRANKAKVVLSWVKLPIIAPCEPLAPLKYIFETLKLAGKNRLYSDSSPISDCAVAEHARDRCQPESRT